MTVVNRVPTLHRPLPEGAPLSEVVAYWQRRLPGVDWRTVFEEAITDTFSMLGAALGLSAVPDLDQLFTEEA